MKNFLLFALVLVVALQAAGLTKAKAELAAKEQQRLDDNALLVDHLKGAFAERNQAVYFAQHTTTPFITYEAWRGQR